MRQIGKKYHVEDGEIRKTLTGEAIPEDEPVFLFRARDRLAVGRLVDYRALCEADSCPEQQVREVGEMIGEFKDFARRHPERMKQPGCTMQR